MPKQRAKRLWPRALYKTTEMTQQLNQQKRRRMFATQCELGSMYHVTTTECSQNGAQSNKYATRRPETTTKCSPNGGDNWPTDQCSKANESLPAARAMSMLAIYLSALTILFLHRHNSRLLDFLVIMRWIMAKKRPICCLSCCTLEARTPFYYHQYVLR